MNPYLTLYMSAFEAGVRSGVEKRAQLYEDLRRMVPPPITKEWSEPDRIQSATLGGGGPWSEGQSRPLVKSTLLPRPMVKQTLVEYPPIPHYLGKALDKYGPKTSITSSPAPQLSSIKEVKPPAKTSLRPTTGQPSLLSGTPLGALSAINPDQQNLGEVFDSIRKGY